MGVLGWLLGTPPNPLDLDDGCGACGAEPGEPCRPMCLGEAAAADLTPCETDPDEPDPCIHTCLDCLGCETCCGCTDREPATALRPWPCPHTCQTCLGCPDCCECPGGGDWRN